MSESLPRAKVEKLNALERYAAPGADEDARSRPLCAVCCFHVPFPSALVFEGVNRHSCEFVVEHDPVYTEISPAADIDGENVAESSWRNGRFEVRVFRLMFAVDIVEEMFRDTS